MPFDEPLEYSLQRLPRQSQPAELRQKRHLHLILYLCNTVLHFNWNVQAGAHFRYVMYGRENGSSATGGGSNVATIAKHVSKLVEYSGAVE